jgi:endonuclease/exonuclease/phosphatase family metal-dependent hydrolase
MPSFPKPKFSHTVNLSKEIKAIRHYKNTKEDRQIPESTKNNLRIATWNIANLGAQEREESHLKIIAEIISWFDLVAVQEGKENSEHFQKIVQLLGKSYQFIFCDASGNNERLAFIYNSKKIEVLQEVAELAIPPSDYKDIHITGSSATFSGFDRSPYMVSFKANKFSFVLLNVHLYFGTENEPASIGRRCLEAYCVGRWADLRSKSKYSFTANAFALGDFNLPKVDVDDPVHKALVDRGLQLPEHTSKIYSNLNNDKCYDQIAFMPGLKGRIKTHGIFDFDNAAFAEIYQGKTPAEFRSYIRYFISDHRPMWMELDITEQL